MDMEELNTFLKGSLVENFYYTDDEVVDSLQKCIKELRKAGMELPPIPTPPQDEKPQHKKNNKRQNGNEPESEQISPVKQAYVCSSNNE